MTTRTHPGIGMAETEHQSGDNVLLVGKGHLAGGNHQGPETALGVAHIRDMVSHTQGKPKGREVHLEIGHRDA